MGAPPSPEGDAIAVRRYGAVEKLALLHAYVLLADIRRSDLSTRLRSHTSATPLRLELDAKFDGLGLGLVDGMVAAVAERRQVYRVLTSDRRDFGAIRIGPRFARALELLP